MTPCDQQWDLFLALTCDHPMLNDYEDYMLPPYRDVDIAQWKDEK